MPRGIAVSGGHGRKIGEVNHVRQFVEFTLPAAACGIESRPESAAKTKAPGASRPWTRLRLVGGIRRHIGRFLVGAAIALHDPFAENLVGLVNSGFVDGEFLLTLVL